MYLWFIDSMIFDLFEFQRLFYLKENGRLMKARLLWSKLLLGHCLLQVIWVVAMLESQLESWAAMVHVKHRNLLVLVRILHFMGDWNLSKYEHIKIWTYQNMTIFYMFECLNHCLFLQLNSEFIRVFFSFWGLREFFFTTNFKQSQSTIRVFDHLLVATYRHQERIETELQVHHILDYGNRVEEWKRWIVPEQVGINKLFFCKWFIILVIEAVQKNW